MVKARRTEVNVDRAMLTEYVGMNADSHQSGTKNG